MIRDKRLLPIHVSFSCTQLRAWREIEDDHLFCFVRLSFLQKLLVPFLQVGLGEFGSWSWGLKTKDIFTSKAKLCASMTLNDNGEEPIRNEDSSFCCKTTHSHTTGNFYGTQDTLSGVPWSFPHPLNPYGPRTSNHTESPALRCSKVPLISSRIRSILMYQFFANEQ